MTEPPNGQDRPYDVLLLDFGGVCLLNPVELHARAESILNLPMGTFTWKGPLDESTDELWREMITGQSLTERDYWAQRAAEVGRAGGVELTTQSYMTMLYDPPTPELIRLEATDVVSAAKRDGIGVSLLTNDMRAFHGREWEKKVDFLKLVDHIVDCSDTGILKPDARAYERAVDMIGVPADRMLFVDDQPGNVRGAEAAGIDTVWFDVADAASSWHEVANRLG